MGGEGTVEIRAAKARDRDAMERLLRLLSDDAVVRAHDAPVYLAESAGSVVGMVMYESLGFHERDTGSFRLTL